MTDQLHQPLAIGDKVVTSMKYGYAGITIATITAFTPKQVRTTNGIYPPADVLKINEQYAIAIELNPEFFI